MKVVNIEVYFNLFTVCYLITRESNFICKINYSLYFVNFQLNYFLIITLNIIFIKIANNLKGIVNFLSFKIFREKFKGFFTLIDRRLFIIVIELIYMISLI